MATNKDILLKDKNNNNLYPLVHQDYNQHILDEFYFGLNGFLPANTDLNTIKKVGSYWLQSNTQYISAPEPWSTPGTWTTGLLIVYKSRYGYDRRIIQEVIKVGSNSFNTYYRYCDSGGTWKDWFESSGSGGVTDIQVNGTTILSSGIANFYINSAASQYGSNNKIATMADIGAAGGGTVTNIAFSNTGGLSISGSPISTTGTISIGLTQLISSPPSDVALYPIKFGKYGRITYFGSAVTIPTKITDLTNDGNFVQDSSYVHTYNASLSFYRDSSLVKTFTANASTNKSLTFTTTNIGSASLLDKTFVDSVSLTGGSVPTKKSQTIITGGTTSNVTVPLLNKIIGGVSFNDVIIGGSTTAFYPAIDQTVITSATGAYATYSSGILTIFNGNFTSNNNISTSAINVYTGLISGVAGSATEDPVAKVSYSVYTSLSSSNISIIDSVGTLPQLSHTTANISEAISITNTTVLSSVS